MKSILYYAFVLLPLIGCTSTDDSTQPDPKETMYFPPATGNTWETKSANSLGWNETAIPELTDFLVANNSKSFMILVNGRIVMEEYFDGHTASDTWQWNSAGKTLVTSTVGIAQEKGLININTKVSDYLGVGWTSEPEDKEELITSKHLLTMTSGIDNSRELITQENMTYLADAGTRWSYHNVFQKLMDVVASQSNQDFISYFNTNLKNKLGMDGFWYNGLIFKIYHSSTRSMARFGLLALNKGLWDTEQVISEAFFNESISSSQSINPAYGYLWWLNGKSEFMIPGGQTVYPGNLVPNAPADMYAAMGASDQRIYVVPSKNMVIIRMGRASDPDDPNFALSGFDDQLWQKLNAVITD